MAQSDTLTTKKTKRPESTVLWLGFVAVLAIVGTQLATQHFDLPSDVALLPPMMVAIIALVVILSASSRIRSEQERKRSEEMREQELASLREEYNYIASKTIADASTAIKWGIRALEPTIDRLGDVERTTFAHIRERNDVNLELLRNLGLLSRVEQKTITPHIAELDLRDILRDLVTITERTTAAKGATLIYVPPQTPVMAKSDRVILGDIVQSLYYFCLSRTRGHGDALTVRCFMAPGESGQQRPRIIIADNAPAVAEAEREHLFDRVIKDATTGQTMSVNLGPHTAKLLADSLGIELTATATDEQTAFTLTF